MEVSLRNARPRFHPLTGPVTRRQARGIGYTQPPDCTPTVPGGTPNPACIAELERVQQANMSEHDSGQRAIFVDDCNKNWALNDAQYAALGMPRPSNNCEQIYDSRGAASTTPIPVTYMQSAAPPVQVAPPVQTQSVVAAPVMATPPANPGQTYTKPAESAAPQASVSSSAETFLTQPVGGSSVPLWMLLAGAGVLYFTLGRKN